MPEIPDQAVTVTLDPIALKYFSLGGANAVLNGGATLGNLLGGEQIAPDGVGKYQQYERGSIYWSGRPGAEAHLIYGLIFAEWGRLTWEQGPLGYPTSDEKDGPNGPPQRMNTFEYGTILWDPQRGATAQLFTTIPVFGQIIQQLRDGLGIDFGAPVSPDHAFPGLGLQHFQLFKENLSRVLNTIEMHTDGTIWLAYTPVRHPHWYDTYAACEDSSLPPIDTATGPKPFAQAKADNVDPGTWDVVARTFRVGHGSAPRWIRLAPPNYTVPHATQAIPNSGAYCTNDTWRPYNIGGPPEWENLLAENDPQHDNGQRLAFPGQPANAPLNHYMYPPELYQIMQNDPARGLDIMRWRGHPNGDDHSDRRIPWTPSIAEGVVTNSFLSGEDYAGSHRWPPSGYWVGTPPPKYNMAGGTFPDDGGLGAIKRSLSNDWDIFLKPDPDYHFLLASKGGAGTEQSANFDSEHRGNLEIEGEQWLLPVGYRPEVGDRVYMTGRWVIDCGHDDFHAEFHPFELIATAHTEPSQQNAEGGIEQVTAISVSGSWAGGPLEFDVWPPPRNDYGATFRWQEIHRDIDRNINMSATPLPTQQPNHLHVVLSSTQPREALLTKGHNDVYYDIVRRLATKFRCWWQPPTIATPPPTGAKPTPSQTT
jgi:LGFP repeat